MNKALATMVARQLQQHQLPLQIRLRSGQRLGAADAQVVLHVHDNAVLKHLARGHIGDIASAVVEGQADLDGSMREVMTLASMLLAQAPTLAHNHWWTRLWRYGHSLAQHSLHQDAANIQFHYDVSDDFYALWLDPRRIYSCAYYRATDMDLAAAQEAKLDLICRKLHLQADERLLDIGCGWGGLLVYAAEHYGIRGSGITLSRNQYAYAQALIAAKGLQNRLSIHLCDYRDFQTDTPFDKVASIGMFEHVGHAHMTAYFQTVRRLVKAGGLILNHGITAGGTRNSQLGGGMGDFIEKYIFPGGELLHIGEALRHVADAGLEAVDIENLRPHYAKTLWAWSDALEAQLPAALAILENTLSPAQANRVLRAYRLYLAGCAMSFEHAWISIHQILVTAPDGDVNHGRLRGAQSDYPFKRDWMYLT
ncbi:class I SAM-dependent methyltransferase [Vitreoscilla massiliensis]|uniref:Class I SAM-dependent methyltransferase n=1 Tax=Vitreoscilla massiliensis TaxID=1689272 RepID=A0ABY4E3Q0_9NEIS|nr:class I SAM-dependent methyltransferase [Vitreoscilla massiliensis]UOO90137.1 class I SAM-dependent methyltransferase [Vitreoscilla massiliensis]